MSDPHRASQAERPLSIDDYGAQPRGVGGRGGPAPITLILSVILLAVVGGGVFYMYRGGLRAPGAPPAPVGSPVGDVRVAAPPQPQQLDPAAGLSIYKDTPGAPAAAPAFVPPPEQPTARPGAQTPPPAPQATANPDAPAVPAATRQASPDDDAEAPAAAAPKHQKADAIDKLLAEADIGQGAKHATVAATGGHFAVQIGAFSSEALADKSWNAVAGLAPGSMAGKGKRVTPVTTADGATLYRTAITGFDTRDQAQALCAKLSAAGRTCFVR